jgi:hypothetical protein
VVGGQDGAAGSADKEEDEAGEAAEIVASNRDEVPSSSCEGEEYFPSKDHFKDETKTAGRETEKRKETGDGE